MKITWAKGWNAERVLKEITVRGALTPRLNPTLNRGKLVGFKGNSMWTRGVGGLRLGRTFKPKSPEYEAKACSRTAVHAAVHPDFLWVSQSWHDEGFFYVVVIDSAGRRASATYYAKWFGTSYTVVAKVVREGGRVGTPSRTDVLTAMGLM